MRVVRLFVNWLTIFLAPIWVFPVVLCMARRDWNRPDFADAFRKGKLWWWQ